MKLQRYHVTVLQSASQKQKTHECVQRAALCLYEYAESVDQKLVGLKQLRLWLQVNDGERQKDEMIQILMSFLHL